MADERRESQERHRQIVESLAGQRHESQEQHWQAMETLTGRREALEALIERTAPRPAPGNRAAS